MNSKLNEFVKYFQGFRGEEEERSPLRRLNNPLCVLNFCPE